MKYKANLPVTKGMLFIGCSYTWGQGLYYYSNSPTLIEGEMFGYSDGLYNLAHQRFKETVRYPRIVAQHFNSYEVVHPKNGGAVDQQLEYWQKCFADHDRLKRVKAFTYDYYSQFKENFQPDDTWYDTIDPLKYEDFSHVIFQLTQWMRTRIEINYKGQTIQVKVWDCWDKNTPYYDILQAKIKSVGKDLGEFHDEIQQRDINSVKSWLRLLETRGIKTGILTYPYEWVDYIKKDPWLAERFIELDYKDSKYSSIEAMMDAHKHLAICNDYENFEVPPTDAHPSLGCHKIIADNVIKYIENKK